MAAKSKRPFNYVAHIQKENGTIAELAGTHEDYSMKKVYQYLLGLARDMGGWLLADNITEADAAAESRCTYNEEAAEPESVDDNSDSPTIGTGRAWGMYTRRYAGVSKLTFKE